MGRYRTRTWIRGHLPYALTWLAPKGSQDCGDHEWYRDDESTARCYHCEPAEHPLATADRVTPEGIAQKEFPHHTALLR